MSSINAIQWFQKNYMPLYSRVIKLKVSQKAPYPYFPGILVKRNANEYSLYANGTELELWSVLFRTEPYPTLFFAYYMAVVVSLLRLDISSCTPVFSGISKNKFEEITIITSKRHIESSVRINCTWFPDIANNISLLNLSGKSASRFSAWRLFFASLALYNALIDSLPDLNDQFSLVSIPGQAWRVGTGSLPKETYRFSQHGKLVYEKDTPLYKEEFPQTSLTVESPDGDLPEALLQCVE